MTDCTNYKDHLHDYVDGALGSVEAIHLTAHLSECADCTEEIEAIERLKAILRATEVPDGEETRMNVMRRFRAAAQSAQAPYVPLWRRWQLGVAACAFVAAILAFSLPSGPDRGPTLTKKPIERLSQLPSSSELDRLTLLHSESSGGMPMAGSEHLLDAASDASSRIAISIAP